MTPDPGPGIPGWFVALFVLFAIAAVGSIVWRISVARKIASDAGLDPKQATAVTLLSNDGVSAAYLASALASRSGNQSVHPSDRPKTAEERLRELQNLKDRGLISKDEYEAQRQAILGSI